MPAVARYLTHPQVLIDPAKEVPQWSLNETGKARVSTLARSLGVLRATRYVISSNETKALETAKFLASALGVSVIARPEMGENDRSATGYLPADEFERVADQFFANPNESACGWETAADAQKRIVREVDACLTEFHDGDVLFVGHGGVGTLLFCALAGHRIDRRFDQGPGGGGCWYQFDLVRRVPTQGWQPMETMISLDLE